MIPIKNAAFNLLLFIFTISLFGCSKASHSADTPPASIIDSIPKDSLVKGTTEGTIKGFAYLIVGSSSLTKVNMETGEIIWQTSIYDLASSSGSDLNYDSGYLYHGNYKGLTCYNISDGSMVWHAGWLSYSNVLAFTKYAFNDSLIFIVSPTSAYDASYLFCLDKRSGISKWKTKIDEEGWGGGRYSAIPVTENNKVIVLTRAGNGAIKLSALDVSSGKKVWDSETNQQLTGTLKISEGKVYSTGQGIYCYDAVTGNQVWHYASDLKNGNSFAGNLSFLDQNKLIITGTTQTSTSCNILILDKESGALIKKLVINEPYTLCMYRNNHIYLSIQDTNFYKLRSYDLNNTSTYEWEYQHFSYNKALIANKNIFFSIGPLSILNFDGELVKAIPNLNSRNYLFVDSAKNVYTQHWN
jgi:outer membrane protein assembly factor BamB